MSRPLPGASSAPRPCVTAGPGHLVSDLETNPRTQYKVHLYGVIYWLINFPAIVYLFFGQPNLWTKLGIFITLIYSIYA
jgi:hypothetical protein